MIIDDKLIEYLEVLARLELTDAEKEKAKKDLSDILQYIDLLNELDTDGVTPMSHVLPIQNVMREDEVKPSFAREDILKNAPQQKNGCYKVPKAVD